MVRFRRGGIFFSLAAMASTLSLVGATVVAGTANASGGIAQSASGTVAPEGLIDFDGRVQVNPTTDFPATATVDIRLGNAHFCSGFFVNDNTVVTAGHCVVAPKHTTPAGVVVPAKWKNRAAFRLFPGRNGVRAPYTCPGGAPVLAQFLWTNKSWADGLGSDFDYAAIRTNCIPETANGGKTGSYNVSNTEGVPNAYMVGKPIITRGYPGRQARHAVAVRRLQEDRGRCVPAVHRRRGDDAKGAGLQE